MSVLGSVRAFLDRFVHPWIAAIVLSGLSLITVAAVAAIVAVAAGNLGYYRFEARFVPLSALVSLLGILVIAACTLYLGVLRLLQVAGLAERKTP
ncbi:hypothetical protein [Salarchaeum japonicum]|uniref:ABC transporter permease n=1 Tax=Salarchaeum japonicum TaxID=555573 RepID=A0AAV3SYK1_9EURY|nr:hypothetical protein [Salarchaeum japonicum]